MQSPGGLNCRGTALSDGVRKPDAAARFVAVENADLQVSAPVKEELEVGQLQVSGVAPSSSTRQAGVSDTLLERVSRRSTY
jgi:hypothetical protein